MSPSGASRSTAATRAAASATPVPAAGPDTRREGADQVLEAGADGRCVVVRVGGMEDVVQRGRVQGPDSFVR